MTDYTKRLARDRLDRLDRCDPDRMLASLKLQGVAVTKIQMRTLCFDSREQLERLKITNPELAQAFILLFRGDLENPA
jgi:hypothetical protein